MDPRDEAGARREVPSVTDSMEPQTRTLTTAMADRLRRIALDRQSGALHRVADRIRACEAIEGWRCGQASCPRCSVQRSRKYKLRLEEMFREIPEHVALALMTVTVLADSIGGGLAILSVALSKLRRRAAWRGIVGGEQFFQVHATTRKGVFNVHAHLICELAPGAEMDVSDLRRAWVDILGADGVGSLHYRAVHARWPRT